ncbi:MAG TPA: Lrp/AsnC family transcriptional regulator [Porticoccus sp.]|nr:Lrp/AsnC family transcriptional regulator [Porticoccus sp.]
MTEFDSIDVNILKQLQKDASLTAQEIAAKVNLSTSPCWRRINRLEKDGFIQKKVALLDSQKLGMQMIIFVSISLSKNDEESLETFEEQVQQFPEIVECYTVTGTMDYFLKIITKDIQHFERFLRQHLAQLPLIREMHSNVAVTQIKYSTELPLDTQL